MTLCYLDTHMSLEILRGHVKTPTFKVSWDANHWSRLFLRDLLLLNCCAKHSILRVSKDSDLIGKKSDGSSQKFHFYSTPTYQISSLQ